jgi:hypothetical protein
MRFTGGEIFWDCLVVEPTQFSKVPPCLIGTPNSDSAMDKGHSLPADSEIALQPRT